MLGHIAFKMVPFFSFGSKNFPDCHWLSLLTANIKMPLSRLIYVYVIQVCYYLNGLERAILVQQATKLNFFLHFSTLFDHKIYIWLLGKFFHFTESVSMSKLVQYYTLRLHVLRLWQLSGRRFSNLYITPIVLCNFCNCS